MTVTEQNAELMYNRRVKQEIRAFAEAGYQVEYDHDYGIITIIGFPTPDGWTPETVTILLQLPDDYPETAPALFVENGLERTDGYDAKYYLFETRRGWKQFHESHVCARDWWDPETHTTITMVRQFSQWLAADHFSFTEGDS